MSYKNKLKNKLPDNILYKYRVIKMVPNYVKYYIKDLFIKYPEIELYDDSKVIDLIVNEKKSLCRFGDGEFMWMLNIELENSFQNCSTDLSEKLNEIMKNRNNNLLIGVPKGLINSSEFNLQAKMHWKIVRNKYFKKICNIIPNDRVYCDASITRPYIDYKVKKNAKQRFDNLKKIWNDRNIIIVEGKDSKLGIGNDLFCNSKSIKRIICPTTNAYNKYSEILERIKENTSDELILLSLGPTATVLASDLCSIGYQAIDIGHIDIEYMWFLNNSKVKEEIKGKYVGESGVTTCDDIYASDIEYLKSICAKVM